MRCPRGQALPTLVRLASIETDECVEWPYADAGNGYGQLCINGKNHKAHRLACTLVHGPPPAPRLVAAHSCDNRSCVNPRHIRWATEQENHDDAVARDRQAKGTGIPQHRLSPEQVVAIRAAYARGGVRQSDLALQYGVSQSLVSLIVRGRSWAWLDGVS